MKNKQYVKIPIPFLKIKLSLSEIIIISLSYTFRYSQEIEKKKPKLRYYTPNKTDLSKKLDIKRESLYNIISKLKKLKIIKDNNDSSSDLEDNFFYELFSFLNDEETENLNEYSFLFDKSEVKNRLKVDKNNSQNNDTSYNNLMITSNIMMTNSHSNMSKMSSDNDTYINNNNSLTNSNNNFLNNENPLSSPKFSNENFSEDSESEIRSYGSFLKKDSSERKEDSKVTLNNLDSSDKSFKNQNSIVRNKNESFSNSEELQNKIIQEWEEVFGDYFVKK